jgi:glycosyltransferase involved in cell wall biosynthesis
MVHADQFDRLVRSLGLSEFRRMHPQLETLAPVVVVIPAYDEAENVGAVIEAMPESVCGLRLAPLVIDDGSNDDTAGVAQRAGALVVKTPVNRGGGAALRLGFDIAIGYGAEIVVTMDADGQHLPSEIESLVRPLVESNLAFVIGSRILGRHERDNRLRWLGIHVFNTLIRLLTPVKISDCSNGFRALRTRELSQLLLRQDQFHTAELIIEAAKRGIPIGEAPVTVRRRASGESKKGRDWSYGLSFARTVIKTWWRY